MRNCIFGLVLLAACSPKPAPEPKTEEKAPMKTKTKLTDAEYKLTPEQYAVCREKGTERAGSGEYDKHFKDGVYKCVCCDTELFSSKTKYESHCGWPSFWDAIPGAVHFDPSSLEATCATCDSHLGHVFDDGPPPTGKRY